MTAKMTLTAEVEKITWQEAEKALGKNPMNRGLQHHLVRLYSKQMRDDLWELIPAPICFSKEGFLLQGQHRLSAQVDSQTDQEYLVCRGVDKSLFPLFDTGMSRNGEDMLIIKGGFNHPALYNSLILQFLKYQNGSFWGHGNRAIRPMPVEILNYALEHKEELALTVNWVKRIEKRSKYFSERMFCTAYHIIRSETKAEEAGVQHWFRTLITAEAAACDAAQIWLRDEFITNQQSSRKLKYQNQYAAIFYAWNGSLSGKFIPVDPASCRDIVPL